MTESIYRYWGKARTNDDGSVDYHLLPYHCLDVAAVGHAWWQQSKSLREQTVRELNLPEEKIYPWLMFFIALHDYGKFDIRFQMKVPEIAKKAYFNAPAKNPDSSYNHGDTGFNWFVQDIEIFVNDWQQKKRLEDWLEKTAGHHGKIPAYFYEEGPAFVSPEITEKDKHSRLGWVKELKKLFLEPASLDFSDVPDSVPSTLAGFCSICDWIGSNSDYFKISSAIKDDLNSYFESREEVAQQALTDFGLFSTTISAGGMKTLFPEYVPRGLQKQVDKYHLSPGLTLIEAPTGSGKTEAALAYASRLLAGGVADSIIFALPTQATANAMLTRIEDVAARFFKDGSNVVLAHGKRDYNQDFVNLKESSKLVPAEGKEEAFIQCSEWLASSKKRVFLGQIGVCTVDQVLLSVLPVRHNFVRAFGVQKSILIIDEVHAYDSYMYGLLGEVLKGQKQAGGVAILLSATLPQCQRNQLMKTWGFTNEETETLTYPLVTQTDGEKIFFYDLEEKDRPEERIVRREIWESKELKFAPAHFEQVVKAAETGAMVAVICNLVADAQKIYEELAAKTEAPVDLFHSRFRFTDRQNHEEKIKKIYGKESERIGRILVATQVVEQSLDLDFDWMITQLCPVDLLFQRLGRLHRHKRERPAGFENPSFVLVAPENESLNFGNSQYVYQNHRALWRTQKLLEKDTEIIFPEAYRDWIEKVYQQKPWGDEPEKIEEGYQKYMDEQEASKYCARQICQPGINPFSDENEKVTALTRDGEMSITVLPVTIKNKKRFTLEGKPFDELEDWQKWEAINQNSVGVPKSWLSSLPKADDSGIHYLEMEIDQPENWKSEFKGGNFVYSKNQGLERKRL